jgi:hypothetical protein
MRCERKQELDGIQEGSFNFRGNSASWLSGATDTLISQTFRQISDIGIAVVGTMACTR